MLHHQIRPIGMITVHPEKPAGASSVNKTKFPVIRLNKPSPGLPLNVIRHVKPIYEELSTDSLLK